MVESVEDSNIFAVLGMTVKKAYNILGAFMIILITGLFPVFDKRGVVIRKEFGTSHGVDSETLQGVVTSNDHPSALGAVLHPVLGHWVILGKDETIESTSRLDIEDYV